jgi:hypothetical protein
MASCSQIPVFQSDLINILTLLRGDSMGFGKQRWNSTKDMIKFPRCRCRVFRGREKTMTSHRNYHLSVHGTNYGRIRRGNLIKFNNFCHHNVSILLAFEALTLSCAERNEASAEKLIENSYSNRILIHFFEMLIKKS